MIIEELNRYRIILASRSPRRQQLLKEMGIEFDVYVTDGPEYSPPGLKGEEIAMHVARGKAGLLEPSLKSGEIIIAADTIVWCCGRTLEKPSDDEEAFEMLRCISGRTHEVITGVCLLTSRKEKIFAETTEVTFERLTDEEISYYVKNYKPFDKAGAYGIQEWIGFIGCSRIEGSYFNVMGLPVHRLYTELKEIIKS